MRDTASDWETVGVTVFASEALEESDKDDVYEEDIEVETVTECSAD